MLIVKCIEKLRDKHNVIYGYTIEDLNGVRKNVQATALKNAIATKQVDCLNLTLTSDGKLIDSNRKLVGTVDNQSRIIESNVNEPRNKMKVAPTVIQSTINPKTFSASIFGISLKNIRELVGREGNYYTGTVYKNGKRLGTWSQDGNGAIVDWFDFNEIEIADAVKQYSKFKNDKELSNETFMQDLVILSDYLKEYKAIKKQGKNYLIAVTDNYDMCVAYVSAVEAYLPTGELHPKIKQLIDTYSKEIIKNSPGKPVIKIFKSYSDFIIQ